MDSQPSSRTGENSPYGMIGGIEETSASFEARSAPRSYPTPADLTRLLSKFGRSVQNTLYYACNGRRGRSDATGRFSIPRFPSPTSIPIWALQWATACSSVARTWPTRVRFRGVLGKMVQRHVSTPTMSILKRMFLCSIGVAFAQPCGFKHGACHLYVGSMEANSIPSLGALHFASSLIEWRWQNLSVSTSTESASHFHY